MDQLYSWRNAIRRGAFLHDGRLSPRLFAWSHRHDCATEPLFTIAADAPLQSLVLRFEASAEAGTFGLGTMSRPVSGDPDPKRMRSTAAKLKTYGPRW